MNQKGMGQRMSLHDIHSAGWVDHLIRERADLQTNLWTEQDAHRALRARVILGVDIALGLLAVLVIVLAALWWWPL
jgi:hypothetical protein